MEFLMLFLFLMGCGMFVVLVILIFRIVKWVIDNDSRVRKKSEWVWILNKFLRVKYIGSDLGIKRFN